MIKVADENVKEKTTETSAAQKRTESFGSYKEHTIDAKNRLFIPTNYQFYAEHQKCRIGFIG